MVKRRHNQQGGNDQEHSANLHPAGTRRVQPPHEDVTGDNSRKKTGAGVHGDAEGILAPVQKDERRKYSQASVEQANRQSGQHERTAEQMGESEAQIIHDRAPANEGEYPRYQHEGGHGDHLLFHKVANRELLVRGLGIPRHAWKPQRVSGHVGSQVHDRQHA